MANIFGKEKFDYKYLLDTQIKNPEMHQALLDKGFTGKSHNFNILQEGQKNTLGLFGNNQLLHDAPGQGVNWLAYSTEAMQAEIEEIFYSGFRLDDYFPIKTNIPEGASSYFYRVVDRQGQGEFIENYGTNAPVAGITAQKVAYKINRGGIIPQWSDEDLRQAIFSGIPLDTETLDAATTGCMQHIEQVGLGNDPSQRFEGLLNLSTVPVATATTPWNQLTPDQVLREIQSHISFLVKNTNEIFGRKITTELALYCSIDLADFIEFTPRTSVSDATIFEMFQTKNTWTAYTGLPVKLKRVQELTTAGPGNIERMLFGYPQASEVWEMGMPISPRVMFIDRHLYLYQAPMEYKISGLNAKRPGGMLYVDNVFV